MALPPTDTTDEAFLREVDEELRRDQALNIWRRWGRWIVAAVVLGLLAFGGVLLVNSLNARAAEKQGETYDAASQNIANHQPGKAFDDLKQLSVSSTPGYRAMARFSQADILLGKNDVKGATAKYSEIAADTSLPQPFRDIALVRQTAAEFDSLKPQVVIDRLKGLSAPDSPYFGSAAELVAAAYLKLGKRDVAGKLFGQISQTDSVPETIRRRAGQVASLLGVGVIDVSGAKKTK